MVTLESINTQLAANQQALDREYMNSSTPPTAAQTDKMNGLMDNIKNLKRQRARLDGDDETRAAVVRDYGFDPANGQQAGRRVGKSLGQQFIENPAIAQWLQKKGYQAAGGWRSGEVDLHATVLTESPTSGGGLVTPTYVSGVVSMPVMMTPTVADLLAQGTTDSNAIVYMQQTAYDNQAAVVAEGGTKPESGMTFAAITEPARKVAHWLPVTEEMFEDVALLASYIDAQLIAGVRAALDVELLTGSGVAPHFLGLLNRPGMTPPLPQGAMTAHDAVFIQKQNIRIATKGIAPADGIVIHPADTAIFQLAKTATGEYLSGGPSAAPGTLNVWGLPVVESEAITRGTALIGSFKKAAQLFMRGPIRTEASNSHADFWIKNLIALRSEVRASLAVYRPLGFGLVTGLAAPVVTP